MPADRLRYYRTNWPQASISNPNLATFGWFFHFRKKLMGDCTYVTLQILASQQEEADAIIGEDTASEEWDRDNYHFYGFTEVDYGELSFLRDFIAQGIAFESRWEAGSEYTAGSTYARFTPEGESVRFDVYDERINPPIDKLLSLIDNYAALRKYIEIHHKSTTPLPLDEKQVEYGKKYRAIQLIAPQE